MLLANIITDLTNWLSDISAEWWFLLVIVVGHTRYKAAQKLGMEFVPVHVAMGLSPEQACKRASARTIHLDAWRMNPREKS